MSLFSKENEDSLHRAYVVNEVKGKPWTRTLRIRNQWLEFCRQRLEIYCREFVKVNSRFPLQMEIDDFIHINLMGKKQ